VAAQSKVSEKYRNRLLATLAPADLALLEPQLNQVTLERRKRLELPNKTIQDVYFMEHGIASVVALSDSKGEIGLIGCEGVSGMAVILGNHRSPHSTFMQVAGDGQRISVAAMRAAMSASPTLQNLLLRYAQSFMIQTAHTAAANVNAPGERRLARWLLMAHDRIDGDEIPLTHEFISIMLGTRRPGVTEAMRSLAHRGLIKTARGLITLIDRVGLEKHAGKYYGVPEAEYTRMIG
jgi:CRP-like cAMP-binding protein